MERRKELLERVMELSGQRLQACYQCGKCTAGCPVHSFMDIKPREMIRRILEDDREVLDSKTPWICATCFTCSARCPNEIDIARVMEALRAILLRAGVDHFSPSQLSQTDLEQLPQIALISCFRKMTG